MPNEDVIMYILESFDSLVISIAGISNIVAGYAESTSGDRLLLLMEQKCNNHGIMYMHNDYGVARLIKRDTNSGTFINISYIDKIFNSNSWVNPFGFEYFHPDYVMRQLSMHGISMFNDVHRAAMAIR